LQEGVGLLVSRFLLCVFAMASAEPPAGKIMSAISAAVKVACEMCGQPSSMSCDRCNVTYYCGKEHQVIDWHGIHEKICPLLAPLRNAPPIVSSEDERLRRNLTVKMSQVFRVHLLCG
jgi:hypothetical protein